MRNPTLQRQAGTGLAPFVDTVHIDVAATNDAPTRSRCREIRAAQEEFREALAQFLNQPSMETYEGLRAAGGSYLDFERRVILPFADSYAATDFQADELRNNHDQLVRAFNIVLWDTMGTYRLVDDAAKLRHIFLQQVDLCERAVCPVIDLRD
jgi:hypothetical protein